jgi:hypothetical protein
MHWDSQFSSEPLTYKKRGRVAFPAPMKRGDAEFAHSVLSIRYGIQKNTFKGFGKIFVNSSRTLYGSRE